MVIVICNEILMIVIPDYGTYHAIFYRRSDPLTCPRCGGEMKIISITDPQVIRQILEHLAAGSERPLGTEAFQRPAQPRGLSWKWGDSI